MEISTLENWLWEAACSIRGPLDAPKYKDYILPLLFYKRLCDVFEDELLALVGAWAGRLDIELKRVQLRTMRNKWGSISTAGTLTLATKLLDMPSRLVEYVICHELLHLKVPTHSQVYRLLLSQHIPDWREREEELGRWVPER